MRRKGRYSTSPYLKHVCLSTVTRLKVFFLGEKEASDPVGPLLEGVARLDTESFFHRSCNGKWPTSGRRQAGPHGREPGQHETQSVTGPAAHQAQGADGFTRVQGRSGQPKRAPERRGIEGSESGRPNSLRRRQGAAAGSGWPARRRNHFRPLCTGHRPYRGTLKPSARLDRTNWHHGSPDGKPWMGRCRALQSEPANLSTKRGHGQIWVDNLENTLRRSRGAIGRYQATPGAPLEAARVPRRPWTAPTTFPGAGRGLTVTYLYLMPSPTGTGHLVLHPPTSPRESYIHNRPLAYANRQTRSGCEPCGL